MLYRSIADIPTLSFIRFLIDDFNGDYKARRSYSVIIVSADVDCVE